MLVTSSNKEHQRPELPLIPAHWEVSFPLDENSRVIEFHAELGRTFGVIVHRFTDAEARFILRGELKSKDDLVICLQAGEKFAQQLNCNEIVTQEKIRPDWLDAAVIFQKCGYKSLDKSWIFECPFEPFSIRVQRVMQLLERTKAIPQDARVSQLGEGSALARALLNNARLMDGFDFDNRLKPGAAKPISAEHSQLVWVGQTLAGIILVAPTGEDGTYEIPVRYIVPKFRQTWVNAVLIHSCVKRGRMMRATTIRFNANAKTHHETIRLAEQAGCVRIASSHRYGKQIL